MNRPALYLFFLQFNLVVKGLGIRIHKVNMPNEKDCIKIKPRSWLDRKDWGEINDVLGVQGFNWRGDSKDSSWIRINQ